MDKFCNRCKTKNPKHIEKYCRYCPKCGSDPSHHEMRNYSMIWHEGDIFCLKCDSFVRSFDAG
jgi:hypothetical protein